MSTHKFSFAARLRMKALKETGERITVAEWEGNAEAVLAI